MDAHECLCQCALRRQPRADHTRPCRQPRAEDKFASIHVLTRPRVFLAALTSGMGAGLVCAKVFGRDEQAADHAGFEFTQPHIDAMIVGWKEIMRPQTWGKIVGSPPPDR